MAKRKKARKINQHWRDLLFIGEIEEIIDIRRHLIRAEIYKGEEQGITQANNAAERLLGLLQSMATYLAHLEKTIPEEARNNRVKRLFDYVEVVRDHAKEKRV